MSRSYGYWKLQLFNGKLIVGLGNSFSDFTVKRESTALFAEKFLKNLSGDQAKKYEASKNFIVSVKAVAARLVAPVKGVNLADGLAYLWDDEHVHPIDEQQLISRPYNIVKSINGSSQTLIRVSDGRALYGHDLTIIQLMRADWARGSLHGIFPLPYKEERGAIGVVTSTEIGLLEKLKQPCRVLLYVILSLTLTFLWTPKNGGCFDRKFTQQRRRFKNEYNYGKSKGRESFLHSYGRRVERG